MDIVERLRSYARNLGGPAEDYLTWQAADEIERLRALLVEAEKYNGWHQEAMLEVERLREALEIIAGRRQPLDNLMGNVDIAREALSLTTRDGESR